MIPRPNPDEYAEYYGRYIARVSENNVLELLHDQPLMLNDLLSGLSDDLASVHPAPDEWNIKQVVEHMNDVERIFSFRGLCFSRRDETPIPGFDQNDYIRNGIANRRTLADLLEEFDHLRAANRLFITSLPPESWTLRGTASNNPFSVRALIYVIVGHVEHHLESLRTVYLKQQN